MHRNQIIWLKIQTLAFRYSDRVEKQSLVKDAFEIKIDET